MTFFNTGTCHADDSYQLLADVCSYIPIPGEEEYKMVETMGKLFTNFAKTGFVDTIFSNQYRTLTSVTLSYKHPNQSL